MMERMRLNYDFFYTTVQQTDFVIKRYLKAVNLDGKNFLEHVDSRDLRPELFSKLIYNRLSANDSIFRLSESEAYRILPKEFRTEFPDFENINDYKSAYRSSLTEDIVNKIKSISNDTLFGTYMRFRFTHEDFREREHQLCIALYDQQALDMLFGLVTRRKTEAVALGPNLSLLSGKSTTNLQTVLEKIVEHELRTSTPFI